MKLPGIAIVEDTPEVRTGLERIIRAAPDMLLLGSYSSAEEALEALPHAAPDMVVMDISLPGMSGIECVRRMKQLLPAAQAIMFTIYESSDQVFEALEAGANGYLLKHTPPEKMLEALRELHSGGAPMSAVVARKVVARFQKSETGAVDVAALSTREQEVLQLLAKGLLYKEIADRLGISTGTVKQHIHKMYEKLHVQNRTEALNKAFGGPH